MTGRQAAQGKRKAGAPGRRLTAKPRKRAEQERAIATRLAILAAAVSEFADKGFEAASIRSIGERTGLLHPLITYHFPTKDLLWRAAAEYVFAQIRSEWDQLEIAANTSSAVERLRQEYRAVFRYTVAFPEFHRFMRQEALTDNPRLKWAAETILAPLLERLLPQIKSAQDDGMLPRVEPIIFHYMMIALTATLSDFGPEMLMTSKLASDDPNVVESYWNLVEEMIFARNRGSNSTPSRRSR
jgi:TetR/AcrR family transcriptional regulator